MSVKVINRKTLAQELVEKKKAVKVSMYKGNALSALEGKETDLIGKEMLMELTSPSYVGTSAEYKLMSEIEGLQKLAIADRNHVLTPEESQKFNAAQYPGQTAIEALIGKMYIDITRRSLEGGDLTSMFAEEMNDPNSDQTVNLNYFKKYVGYMGTVTGSNDPVNLIEQKLGGTKTFAQAIKALGWKDSLENLLFNKVHDMAKVNQAAADADVDVRNAAIIGQIVSATFVASQKQAADATGSTFDTKMYNTIRKGIKKLKTLKDPQTGKLIRANDIYILCNSANTWDLQRVINGQLQVGGGSGDINAMNLAALPIGAIVEYDYGITHGETYGKDTISFPGVTAGICYLYVPGIIKVMNKRGLTLETGKGSVLQLSTEERAWYRVFGAYLEDFLGSSFTGTSLGASYGYVVEVTLPSDS